MRELFKAMLKGMSKGWLRLIYISSYISAGASALIAWLSYTYMGEASSLFWIAAVNTCVFGLYGRIFEAELERREK